MSRLEPVKKRKAASRPPGTPLRRPRRRIVEGVLIFAACVLMIDALFGEKGVVAMMKATQENQQLERRLAAAQAETRRLREDAYWLRRDPAAIEVLARQKLGLIKPGEKVFTIRDAPASEQNVPPAGAR